jgi:tetratricopeptide (TPR) repeat protein
MDIETPNTDLNVSMEPKTESKEKILVYINLLINRSRFKTALDFISQIHFPSLKIVQKWDLQILEAFIKLLIYQGFYNKALTLVNRSLVRAREIKQNDIISILLFWRGKIRLTLKDSYHFDFYEAFELAKDLTENPILQSQTLLGLTFLSESIDKREEILLNALKVLKSNENSLTDMSIQYQEAQVLNALGIYYGLIGNNKLSSDYFNHCIELAKTLGDQRRIAGALLNHATLNFLKDRSDPEITLIGRSMIQKSIRISEQIDSHEYAALGYGNLADYYHKRKRSKETLSCLMKVYELQIKREIINTQQAEHILSLISTTDAEFDSSELFSY